MDQIHDLTMLYLKNDESLKGKTAEEYRAKYVEVYKQMYSFKPKAKTTVF